MPRREQRTSQLEPHKAAWAELRARQVREIGDLFSRHQTAQDRLRTDLQNKIGDREGRHEAPQPRLTPELLTHLQEVASTHGQERVGIVKNIIKQYNERMGGHFW